MATLTSVFSQVNPEAAFQTDLDAFNSLIEQYQDMLYYQALRMLGDPQDAEDLVQDAFLIAFKKRASYRGGSARAWLLRIVVNLSYDALRRRYRRPVVPLEPEGSDEELLDDGPWLEDSAPRPENLAEMHEQEAAVQRALGRLRPDYRAAVVLVDVQGLDYQEAAQAMDVPLGTLKSRLARARTQLRELLGQAASSSHSRAGCQPAAGWQSSPYHEFVAAC